MREICTCSVSGGRRSAQGRPCAPPPTRQEQIITRAFSKLLLWTRRQVSSKNSDWHIARERKSFIAIWPPAVGSCVWEWKPVGTHAGLSACCGVEGGVMDWRRRRNPSEAGTQEEDGSRGRTAYSAVAGRRSFSADLGAELGESGCAAVAVAQAPHGADAHPHHEPVASCGSQRRTALQEELMAGKRTEATGGIFPGAVGEPTPPRSVGAAGQAKCNDRGADAKDRTGSGKIPRGAATENPSRSGCFDGTGVRARHRRGGALSLWQAISVWFRRKIPVANTGGWGTSVNRMVQCCVFSCWKRRK